MMIYGRKTKTAELAEKFHDELLAKKLPKDSPVMSARELAEHFAISPVTANRILKLLVEQDILYCKPQSGTYIKHDPKTVPSIAYAGPLPDPENSDPLLYDASSRLLKHFADLGIQPVLISYYELRHPQIARQKLRNTNGLLIHFCFIDKISLETLWDYSGQIAVIGNAAIENRIFCSQVIPDFTKPLLEFDQFKRFAAYDKILILSASHPNSVAYAKMVRQILERIPVPEKRIEYICLTVSGGIDGYLQTDRYFSQRGDLPDNTLIMSMSEYFSQAIRAVFSSRGKIPDILNFDNMESYQKNNGNAPFFTSIDRQMGLMYCRALDLLCGQCQNPDEEQTILRFPAKLVIRKSVKGDGILTAPIMISSSK